MSKFNFNNKTFALLQNSAAGNATDETSFKYKQKGNLVTADYSGGAIIYGKIIAVLQDDKLEMLYQCLTNNNQLKAGKAVAKITLNSDGRIKLSLDWEWINGGKEKGKSEYIEVK